MNCSPLWKHTGLWHAAQGMVVGGMAGVLMFRSGRGNRAACVAAGIGAAIGSTYQRYHAPRTEKL